MLNQYWQKQSCEDTALHNLLWSKLNSSPKELVQFLLDPSVVPAVIDGCQKKLFNLDSLFALTRTYCYGLHRRRHQLSGTWNQK